MEKYFLTGSQFTARLKGDRAEQLNTLYHHYTENGIQFPSKSDLIDELIKAALEKEFNLPVKIDESVKTDGAEKAETQEPGAKELLLKNKIESLETELATVKADLLTAENKTTELQAKILDQENNNETGKETDESKYYLLPKDNEQLQPVYEAYKRREAAGMSKTLAGFILNIFQWTAKNNPHAKKDLIIE